MRHLRKRRRVPRGLPLLDLLGRHQTLRLGHGRQHLRQEVTDSRPSTASATRRVLVAQSYFLAFDPKLQEAAQPVPPLGALIFAAFLRVRGFEVRVFDAMLAGSEQDCGEAMDRCTPNALVIFEVLSRSNRSR